MPKTKIEKTEVQKRAALRLNEQSRADHAFAVLEALIEKHWTVVGEVLKERDLQELYMLRTRLLHAIKNQHIKDADYAKYKNHAPSFGECNDY